MENNNNQNNNNQTATQADLQSNESITENSNQENNSKKESELKLPSTVEELQKMLQKEADRRVTDARKKIENDFNEKLEKEKSEAARLAKLTKNEKEAEELRIQKEELENQRAEFNKSQLLNQTMINLQQENLPVNFAEYLMAESAEKINENIKTFKQAWQEAIQKEVDNKLTTKTPKLGTQAKLSTSFFDAIKQNKLR